MMRNLRPRLIALALLTMLPVIAGLSAKPMIFAAITDIKIAPASVSPPILPGTASPSAGSPGFGGITPHSVPPAGQAGAVLAITSPLQLSAHTVAIGGSLTGQATLQNQGSAPVTLDDIVIAGRPPGGTNLGGP